MAKEKHHAQPSPPNPPPTTGRSAEHRRHDPFETDEDATVSNDTQEAHSDSTPPEED